MRDDIHKKASVPQHWQRFLRAAVTPAERGAGVDTEVRRNLLRDFNQDLGVAHLRRLEDKVSKHLSGLFRNNRLALSPEEVGIPGTSLARRLVERVCNAAPTATNAHQLVSQEASRALFEVAQSHVRESIATVSIQKGSNVIETLEELRRASANIRGAANEIVSRRLAGEASTSIVPSYKVDPEEDLLG